MKENYSLPDYDSYRDMIRNFRSHKRTWEEISLACRKDEKELEEFLNRKAYEELRSPLSVEGWKVIVHQQQEEEEMTQMAIREMGGAMLLDDSEVVNYHTSTNPRSAWLLYKKKLLDEKHYSPDTVKQMEEVTARLLNCIHLETPHENPVKGLVMGNVQSGKTGNMAALMAMAADQGFNMFIILSGTIENLRAQTADRLFNDLNSANGTLQWVMLEHLSKKSPIGQRAQDCHFEKPNSRYMTVCLKNSTRLKNLGDWLQADSKKQKQMKILVIDDEADQASINTAKDEKERTKINQTICNLVNGKFGTKKSPVESQFQAMNYIGYTATPYANVLNENKVESLYPKNFIVSLNTSSEYFGPQQIFGDEENAYEGLDIVRQINQEDLETIKDIHQDSLEDRLPLSLEEAICWFITGVACQRYWNYHKPISMLIHTSQKTEHHENLHGAIKTFFEHYKTSPEKLVDRCEEIWNRETKRFSKDAFRIQYPTYGVAQETIKDYPSFEVLRSEVLNLIQEDLHHIKMDENDDLQYSNGIHICVDNCRNNGITEEGIHMRLMYPKFSEQYDKAPAFIIIGGTTLSRGLTLEGLISSYFLRSVGQADTLMQMGRWFGYRKGYELLPRIWLTKKTIEQFRFLSDLDKELREEIINMESRNLIPKYYGPKVKNTPSYQFIRVTAKNKMRSASLEAFDFSGAVFHTYRFDRNFQIIHDNLQRNTKFIKGLGQSETIKEENKKIRGKTQLWRNVSFSKVKEYLENYHFGSNMSIGVRLPLMLNWMEKLTQQKKLKDWNIVYVPQVHRTEHIERSNDFVIDIGTLLSSNHLIADVDLTDSTLEPKVKQEILDTFKDKKNLPSRLRSLRNAAHLDTTPLMIIYQISKDSEPRQTSYGRKNLDVPEDLVGFYISIPGGQKGVEYATKLSIPIENTIFDDQGDLEGENDGN